MKLYVLGSGKKIIKQYPSNGSKLYNGSVVALLTDTYDKKMPNLVGLSYKDATNILKLMGVNYKVEGNGYVEEQSVKEGEVVKDGEEVLIKMNK